MPSPLHYWIIEELSQVASSVGFECETEFAVKRSESQRGFIDLLLTREEIRIACDVELRRARFEEDVMNAVAARAESWIITPHGAVARRIKDSVSEMSFGSGHKPISVLTVYQAKQRLLRLKMSSVPRPTFRSEGHKAGTELKNTRTPKGDVEC